MRVLLVTQAFPPYSASGAVRVGRLSSYLVGRGYDIRVITASPLPYPRTLPDEISANRIITTASADPMALLAWLRRRQGSPQGQATGSLVGSGKLGRVLRGAGAMIVIPEPQIGWYPFAVAAGRRLVRDWKPDVIYASALPFTAHLVAARLARSLSVPWIAEFRDHFAGNPYSNLPRWRAPIDRWIERRVVSSAAACVTVSEPMAETLRARHHKPTSVVLNGYDGRIQALAAPDVDGKDRPLRLVYTGIIYPGRRDPSPLFAAMVSMGSLAAHIEVAFYGQDLRSVAAIAQRHQVSTHVRLLGSIPYGESLAEQRRADALLLLLCSDAREVGVYTGKLFEYIGSGRPILAVGSEKGVAAELIRSRGLGVATADCEVIASTLRGWLEEKRMNGQVAGPPEAAKLGLSRDEQFKSVDDLLRRVCKATRAGNAAVTPVADIASGRGTSHPT